MTRPSRLAVAMQEAVKAELMQAPADADLVAVQGLEGARPVEMWMGDGTARAKTALACQSLNRHLRLKRNSLGQRSNYTNLAKPLHETKNLQSQSPAVQVLLPVRGANPAALAVK